MRLMLRECQTRAQRRKPATGSAEASAPWLVACLCVEAVSQSYDAALGMQRVFVYLALLHRLDRVETKGPGKLSWQRR